MAVVIVLEDAWDGHYELSTACHQAGYRVLAVQHPSLLRSALQAEDADALLVDSAIPGVCLAGIGALAADFKLPVIATGYSPWAPVGGLTTFLPKPASTHAVLNALQAALHPHAAVCAA